MAEQKHINKPPRKCRDNPVNILILCFVVRCSFSLPTQARGFSAVKRNEKR